MEAIRSLKMAAIDENLELSPYYKTDSSGTPIKGNIIKANKEKRAFEVFIIDILCLLKINIAILILICLPHR